MQGIDFSGITLPFTANEMLTAGVGLLGVVGGIVLLAIAFRVVPKLIGLIFSAFRSSKA